MRTIAKGKVERVEQNSFRETLCCSNELGITLGSQVRSYFFHRSENVTCIFASNVTQVRNQHG